MNYEQKYKDTIERAKKELEACGSMECYAAKQLFRLFPELKESEDEKIRKALVDALNKNLGNGIEKYGTTLNAALTWLEKQDKSSDQIHYWTEEEIEPIISDYLRGVEHYGGMIGRLRCLKPKSLEKQNDCSVKWQKNTPHNKPAINHSVLMKTTQGIAEGEWQGEDWFQYRWSWTLKDSDVLAWMELSNLDKQGEQKPAVVDFNAKDWYVSKVDGKIHDMTYNPADKVEPKFKVGDWIVNDYCMGRVVEITNDAYLLDIGQGIPFSCEHNTHLWTIQDAKDGDVLVGNKGEVILMFRGIGNTEWDDVIDYHCYYDCCHENFVVQKSVEYWGNTENNQLKPATKKQRDTLFAKMKEAGYEWNAEKKELKKIHVIDDGKAEMDYCFTKMMAGEKVSPAWSEEDKNFMYDTLSNLTELKDRYGEGYGNVGKCIDWLKSLKDRVQPQPKQEWSEKDEEMCQETIDWFEKKCFPYALEEENPARESIKWLKSLKNRLPLVKNC